MIVQHIDVYVIFVGSPITLITDSHPSAMQIVDVRAEWYLACNHLCEPLRLIAKKVDADLHSYVFHPIIL